MNELLRGIASLLDFSGFFATERAKETLQRSDAEALQSDWDAIGRDFAFAVNRAQENWPTTKEMAKAVRKL